MCIFKIYLNMFINKTERFFFITDNTLSIPLINNLIPFNICLLHFSLQTPQFSSFHIPNRISTNTFGNLVNCRYQSKRTVSPELPTHIISAVVAPVTSTLPYTSLRSINCLERSWVRWEVELFAAWWRIFVVCFGLICVARSQRKC